MTDRPATYKEQLDASWARHVARKSPTSPSVVTLFAGCGGSALGYSCAGFRVVGAVEISEPVADDFRANFPRAEVLVEDVRDVTAGDLLPLVGAGNLDVLDASPPCQGFSPLGRRAMDDPRNRMFVDVLRLVEGLEPRAVVVENVPAMARGSSRPLFLELVGDLRGKGYKVKAGVLNAAYLGTPQARDRLVIVGIRGDVAAAAGETSDALMPPPLPWRPWTVREALSDCPVRWPSSIDARSLSYARAIPPGRNRAAITGLIGFSFKRHLMDRPAYTIPAEGGANGSWYGDIHPTEHRKLHGSELMRLGGFPDQWAWESRTTDEIHHRIGNSVPPPMMERVADRVLAVLKAARPRGRSGRKGGRRK